MVTHVRPGDDRTSSWNSSKPGEQPVVGKVAFVGRIADPQTGSLPIRVLVDNPEGRLTIGQSVTVSIIVEERKSVLQVPVAAVLDLGEGPILSIVRDGKSFVLHPEVRTPHQGWVEIAGTDLKEGEPVIIEGGYNLPEKTAVSLLNEKAEAKEDSGPEAKESSKADAKKAEAKEDSGPEGKESSKAGAKEKGE
jgi:membrane fusion protein (multidrug efflux system)